MICEEGGLNINSRLHRPPQMSSMIANMADENPWNEIDVFEKGSEDERQQYWGKSDDMKALRIWNKK
ncbi:unnamed protein product [Cylicostephanus goldi]|uniref:Uncharacterized protein n=1 Tax=Cylicostephanus goldi TaxID=71465 RepID=A0A3P6RNB7_CYLGO|nr:unnamed protein product [Cylicostephanus goldi]